MTATSLSVVIPAFNEEQRIGMTLTKMDDYLSQLPFCSEIVVVNDGSEDRTAEFALKASPRCRVITVSHRGKGFAVKQGILSAKGDLVFVCDADQSISLKDLGDLLADRPWEFDVAVGSRNIKGSRRHYEPMLRRILSHGFGLLVRSLVLPGVSDSQAGFKCFRRAVAQHLVRYQTIDGWAFDVEIVYIARRCGYRVIEVPIDWKYCGKSRVRPLTDAVSMIREVWRIRRNIARGYYAAAAAHCEVLLDSDNRECD